MLMVMSLALVGSSVGLFLVCRQLCATQEERDALKVERDMTARKLRDEYAKNAHLVGVVRTLGGDRR